MIRPILRWPDPVLSQVCAPVSVIDADIRRLADDLLETMYAAPGRGLAAPQVGVALRLFVMDTAPKDSEPAPRVILNPTILDRSETRVLGPEGCLSIPGVTAEVERACEITLQWSELDDSLSVERFTGIAAICAQHEYDHLDGLVTFDRVSDVARKALEDAYLG